MRPITVLVVDDNENFRFLAAQAARIDGRVRICGEATQGVEAIEMAAELQPDVVLLDLQMPMMDGLESIQGIRSMSPHSKILVWSGYDAAFGQDAVLLGADDHISKAVPLRQVIDRMMELTERESDQEPASSEWVMAYLLRGLTHPETGSQEIA